MKSGLIFGIGLIFGGAGGGAAAWFLLKQKFEQQADEEIASVRESFRKEEERRKEAVKTAEEKKADAEEAMKRYSPSEESKPTDKATPANKGKRPYVITPMEFAKPNKNYSDRTLKYYTDGAVTDEDGLPMSLEEIDEKIGRESLTFFGVDGQEEDSVCVRNENDHTDYQILQMSGAYSEVLKNDPALKRAAESKLLEEKMHRAG